MNARTNEARARKHPLLLANLWVVHLFSALVLIWPFASVVRRTYGSHPIGDRVLFEDGAFHLADFVMRVLPSSTAALVGHAVVVIPIAYAIHVMAFGATVATLSVPKAGSLRVRRSAALARAGQSALVLAGQTLVVLLVQVIVIALAFAVFAGMSGALEARYGLPVADRLGAVAASPFVLAVFALVVMRDVAGVHVVAKEVGALRSLVVAFQEVARKPVLLLEYGWRGVATLALLAFSAMAASSLGGRPGAALVVLVFLHQATVVIRIALRMSWLASTLRRST